MDIEKLKINLADSGCNTDDSDYIVRMCSGGNMREALHMMKKNRCRLMEELHEKGRKVDCLDYLIRETEKEISKYGGI